MLVGRDVGIVLIFEVQERQALPYSCREGRSNEVGILLQVDPQIAGMGAYR